MSILTLSAPTMIIALLVYSILSTASSSKAVGSHIVSDFDMQVIEEPSMGGRVRRGFMYCPCSKSSATTQASRALNLVRRSINFMAKSNDTTDATPQAKTFLEDCTTLYSLEDCINGDAELRSNVTKSLCTYDAVTGRNIISNRELHSPSEGKEHQDFYTTVGSCNEHREMARRQPVPLAANSTRIRTGSIECDCSPTSSLPSLGAFNEIMTAQKENATGMLCYSLMAECRRIFSKQECINSDRALRSAYPRPFCTYDVRSGRNLKLRNGTTYVPVGTCAIDNRNLVVGQRSNGNGNVVHANWATEGCIAIEHLRNVPVLHQEHLRRTVYCHNSFCATPNHAIIVRGVGYTSMKRECSETGTWYGECTVNEKLVNNMRLLYHRELRINKDITATPFDYRYPKAVVWIAQIGLESLRFLEIIVLAAAVAGVALKYLKVAFTKSAN